MCKHEWEAKGHGHTKDIYVCRKCGKKKIYIIGGKGIEQKTEVVK